MPEVHLIRENEREMHFAHRPMAGIVIALIGGGLGWFFWERAGDTTGRWLGLIIGLVFTLAGIAAAFWRYELTLDLFSRTYLRRKGFWPNPRVEQGSFQDIEHVALHLKYERTSSKSARMQAHWIVGIQLRGERNPIRVAKEISEERAYKTFEGLAKKLRVTAIDRTDAQEKATPWNQLDASLAERAAAGPAASAARGAGITPVPAESAIEFLNVPGARLIRLPRPNAGAGGWAFVLFGAVFFSFAAFFMWMIASGAPVKNNRPGLGVAVSSVFMLVGAGIVWLGLFAMRGRDVVREESGGLVFATEAFGRAWFARRVERREIEDVSVKESTRQPGESRLRVGSVSVPVGKERATRLEVVVRSDRHVARLGGDLTAAEREWLRNAIVALAEHS